MSRNSSGVYTPAAGVNPVVDGTIISVTWGNDTVNDLAQGLTDSLDRQGRGAMLAALKLTDGTASAPGVSFANETSSGFYRAGTNDIRFRMAGATLLGITPAGVTSLTQAPGNNTTLLATTAFTQAALTLLLGTANDWTKNQRVAPVVLTSTSNSIAVDASLSNNFTHTLTENTTLAAPTNLVDGMQLFFRFKQNISSAYTLAFDAKYKFDGADPVISTTLGTRGLMACYYNADDDVLDCVFSGAGGIGAT